MIATQSIPTEVLRSFTNPEHDLFKDILALWNYRGDLTETGDRRKLAELGEEAYEHYNWDTAVCTGGILLILPRLKHAEAVEPRRGSVGFPAEWYWCFGQIEQEEDVAPASERTIARVVDESRERLAELPELQYMEVRKVHFWEYGRTKKRKSRPAPKDVVFFRFEGGYGVVHVGSEKKGASK